MTLELAAFDADHSNAAASAYARFGKGSGHPAQLSFGDVLAYGLAASRREPLAYVGADFGHTDLQTIALPSAALGSR